MTGKEAMTSLRRLCRALDKSLELPSIRHAAAALAIPASVLVACEIGPPMTLMYGDRVGFDDEICNNETDEDQDGVADCEDSDCASLELCLGCFDGLDNDGDGLADCSDATCENIEPCLGTCDDGEDNDGDNLIDCNDSDCAGIEPCT